LILDEGNKKEGEILGMEPLGEKQREKKKKMVDHKRNWLLQEALLRGLKDGNVWRRLKRKKKPRL